MTDRLSLKARADDTRRRLEAQRPTNPVVDVTFRAIHLHNESGGALLAGAIAFRFFMFLVPCVFVFVMGLGLGADVSGADAREVARQAGIAGVAAKAIESGADASTVTQWVTLVLATFALVLGARNLLRALWVAHTLIWKVRPEKVARPTLAGLAFVGGFALLSLFTRYAHALRGVSFLGWVVALVAYTLVPVGLWLLASVKLFPRPRTSTWRDLWPGALLFGLGAHALHLATVLWVAPSMETKSQTYGAIGAALTILLWAYMLGRLVTSSVTLNATLWRSSAKADRDTPA